MIALVRRLLCRYGFHDWSTPVPLDARARDSTRLGKQKWHRICLRLCGEKQPGYLSRR